jgi:peptide/nickel transport system ATP-binding protein
MYQGEIVERGPLPSTFTLPHHKYTKALLTCRPTGANRTQILPTVKEILSDQYHRKERPLRTLLSNKHLFEIRDLVVKYPIKKKSLWSKSETFNAVENINFTISEGEVLGIVGESGSGKSTIAKCIAGMQRPSSGQIYYQNKLLDANSYRNKSLRRSIQMIFQDPYSSLNPLMTINRAIEEPIRYYQLRQTNAEIEERIAELMSQVGLDESFIGRYPHQLSGGQRQRVCIARALALEPSVLICDESVSALDVSVQAQILNLLDQIKDQYALTIVFISHDLEVVHYLCDRVIVMEKGRIVEEASADLIFHQPKMNYTKKLVSAGKY